MLPRPDRMYPGDGACGEDRACLDRSTPAGEDIQGSGQAVMNPPGQVLGRSFSQELPVDVTSKLDRSSTRLVRKDRAEHQTVVVAEVGSDHCRAERVDFRDRAAGHLHAYQQMLLQVRRRLGGPAAPVAGRQILTEPNDQLCFHGCEPCHEDTDLGYGDVLLAKVILLTPDWADQSVRIPGRTPVRRDIANLPADQRVVPSRYRQLLDLVGLGHAGGDSTREPGQAPPLSSGSDQLGGDDVLGCRCAHFDLSGLHSPRWSAY